jgi:ribose transport system substrate-binding protein
VIITTSVASNVAADGYTAAREAKIPVVSMFSSDPADGSIATVQIGDQGGETQGATLADAITAKSNGDANVLFLTEKGFLIDQARTKAFEQRFAEVCPDCEAKLVQFDVATMQDRLPQQIQAELNQNPDIDWIVGVFDAAASIAVTQVQQAGKQDQIQVAGMDADPPNIDLILKKDVQVFDLAFDFGASSWGAVDAAARLYSGQEVPGGVPANTLLVTPENVEQLLPGKNWPGPKGYEEQFKALWGTS